jgi:hypothetical protein
VFSIAQIYSGDCEMERKHTPLWAAFNWSFDNHSTHMTAKTPPYEKYLTVEDVKRVSKLSEVSQIPFHPAEFLGSDLNFVNKRGDKILCVTFSGAGMYDTYKTMVPNNYQAPVNDLGEEAFMGSDLDHEPFILVFRKGDFAVSLTTSTTRDARRNMLAGDQLVAIGGIIASRLSER